MSRSQVLVLLAGPALSLLIVLAAFLFNPACGLNCLLRWMPPSLPVRPLSLRPVRLPLLVVRDGFPSPPRELPCCRFISFSAFLSSSFCSSCSVLGRVLCLVRCFVRIRACFPLSGSRRSSSSKISGVRGIGSLPLFPLELEATDADPPLSIPELRSSLAMSHEFAPCCLRGANLF